MRQKGFKWLDTLYLWVKQISAKDILDCVHIAQITVDPGKNMASIISIDDNENPTRQKIYDELDVDMAIKTVEQLLDEYVDNFNEYAQERLDMGDSPLAILMSASGSLV